LLEKERVLFDELWGSVTLVDNTPGTSARGRMATRKGLTWWNLELV